MTHQRIKPVPTTSKDHERVASLLMFLAKNGLSATVERATRDAGRIESPAKAEARAYLLDAQGANAVAQPFANRATWLRAQGIA